MSKFIIESMPKTGLNSPVLKETVKNLRDISSRYLPTKKDDRIVSSSVGRLTK